MVIIILKSRTMRKTPMNYMLLNLAVADLMVGVFMTPVFVLDRTFTHPEGFRGRMLCMFVTGGNLTWLGCLSSISSLVFIAIERYFAITKPLSARYRLTTTKLKVFIPICWIVATVISLPEFIFAHYDKERKTCQQSVPAYYSLLWLVLSAAVPISIMVALYGRVIHQLWFRTNDEDDATSQGVRRTRLKVTRMMLTLSAIYVLLWTPDSVIYVLVNYRPDLVAYRGAALNAAVFLVVLNSSLNPLVYTLQFGQFRRELMKLVTPCRRCAAYRLSSRTYTGDTPGDVSTVRVTNPGAPSQIVRDTAQNDSESSGPN